jgi:putative transcriptional regulator
MSISLTTDQKLTPAVIKRLRAEYGLTQEEFADKFGIPVSTLRKWEQGKRRPTSAAVALLRERTPA